MGVELDIFEKRILLETAEPHYKLDVSSPPPTPIISPLISSHHNHLHSLLLSSSLSSLLLSDFSLFPSIPSFHPPPPPPFFLTPPLPTHKPDVVLVKSSLVFLHNSSPQLVLPYPVEEEKAGAKFDKTKKTLTITLPVIPLQTTPTPVRPLVTEVALETTNHIQEPESHDSRSETKSTNQNTEAVPHQSTNQDPELGLPDLDTKPTNQNTEAEAHQSTNQDALGSPELETKLTNQKAGLTTGVPQQWASTGSYECPQFSCRQDEEYVCFVLHTAAVKEKSLVSHFDQHQVSSTTARHIITRFHPTRSEIFQHHFTLRSHPSFFISPPPSLLSHFPIKAYIYNSEL